jgi:hypothetical protein
MQGLQAMDFTKLQPAESDPFRSSGGQMIDTTLQERCRRLINNKIIERRKLLDCEIDKIIIAAGSRGMNYPVATTIGQQFPLLCKELEIRSTVAWQDIVSVHKALGSFNSDTLREDFKEEVGVYIDEAFAELSVKLKNMVRNIPHMAMLNLNKAKAQTIARLDIEIDLYVDSLAISQSSKDAQPASNQYNFYGNIGAVQTGTSPTANIVQNLSFDDKRAIVDALVAVKDQLVHLQDVSESNRQELSEIIDECVGISKSVNPNSTKLLALLNLVGITVQSYASAQPAYNTLKTVLIPLGITLP